MRFPSIPDELIVDPDLAIVDAHHHLWHHGKERYLVEEFARDVADGHKVTATVFVECVAMYRRSGPAEMRAVGEAEFVSGMAAMSESGLYGPTRMCAAFVGRADLSHGARVADVLDALDEASNGRLRGVRSPVVWDEDLSLNLGIRPYAPPWVMESKSFREGFAELGSRNLVYDAWQYHPQLGELCSLADAFPDTPIVINHCGGLVNVNRYAAPDTFAHWSALIAQLSKRPNTLMKLGGLGTHRCGFNFEALLSPPSAVEIATAWQPYIDVCIEQFGPDRCMFESNFPPDRACGSYCTVWNALKLTAQGYSQTEKEQLFSKNAMRVYSIKEQPKLREGRNAE